MTFSCADLRWTEIYKILSKLKGNEMSDTEIQDMTYDEKCKMLNSNPVVVAKNFQYRLECLFRDVLMGSGNPVGELLYHAIRIEFQFQGSPHAHCFIWIKDCPVLTNDNIEFFIRFIDKHISASLPDQVTCPVLHDLVKTYQTHDHSKTCRQYKNLPCRFNFGHFFTERTIIAKALPKDMNEEDRNRTLAERDLYLTKVKKFINEFLNIFDSSNFKGDMTIDQVLSALEITKSKYYSCLSTAAGMEHGIHLKRPPNSCFINNFNAIVLLAWQANMDIQPVFNHHRCVTYLCSYLTKGETHCSEAIRTAAKEARKESLDLKQSLKKIGGAFLSTREVSSKECVYRCLPELWLRKTFPGTIFINTSLPECRIRTMKSREKIAELDDDSTDIFNSNIIERYCERPNRTLMNGIYAQVDALCLAEFASYYYKQYLRKEDEDNDNQPVILSDEALENHHESSLMFPKTLKLMSRKETMKCRKVRAVIRFHTPNKTTEPEKYFHHLLMLYLSWRKESDLIGEGNTYSSKFDSPPVKLIVQLNQQKFEPFAEAVDEALEFIRNNPQYTVYGERFDAFNEQENSEDRVRFFDMNPAEQACITENNIAPDDILMQETSFGVSNQGVLLLVSSCCQSLEVGDDEYRATVRSLNVKQRYAFEIILKWHRDKVKHLASLQPMAVDPIYLFISGGAGAGKSHVIKSVYQTVIKTFKHGPLNPDVPVVLLLAPTGVAAINIGGTVINSALGIPKDVFGEHIGFLPHERLSTLRHKLSDLKFIIIDEISMVSNRMLKHIHERLKQIFGTPDSLLFAGVRFIAVGDLYQLPPIKAKPVFVPFKNDCFNICHPWRVFQMIELDKIMREEGDNVFTDILNRLRVASLNGEDIKILSARKVEKLDLNYPITQCIFGLKMPL